MRRASLIPLPDRSLRRIGGAALDVWYKYPSVPGQTRPSTRPFHEFANEFDDPAHRRLDRRDARGAFGADSGKLRARFQWTWSKEFNFSLIWFSLRYGEAQGRQGLSIAGRI
jgi:hypothetical protein